MRLGQSICLIAFGAALRFAVHAPNDRIDLGVIGVIVMLVGLLSLFLAPSDWERPAAWAARRRIREQAVEPPWRESAVPAPPVAPRHPTDTSLRVVPAANTRRRVS